MFRANPGDDKKYTVVKVNRIIDGAAYVLIVISTIALILESDEEIIARYSEFFKGLEFVIILLFSVEYVYRTVHNFIVNRNFGYNYSAFGIIDLMSILPFYLPLAISFNPRSIRVLSLLRSLRVLKLGRHSDALRNLLEVFRKVRYELALAVVLSLFLITFCGIVIFYVENPAQPEVFNNMANSIWWALSTLTTVGYGDIYPITPLGKLLASVVAFTGIGLIAIPTGLISATYIQVIKEKADAH